MSNQDSEKEYDNFTDWSQFSFRQLMKSIFVCLPGIVKGYDAATKRAKIQVAINLLKTDGTELPYPVIVNVPVIFPASSKFIVQFPLILEDPVLVLFSQRGLSEFKQTYIESRPTDSSFFSLSDAIVIPGFGTLTNTVAKSDALTIQSVDGATYIALENDLVTVKATEISLEGNVSVSGNLTVEGKALIEGETTIDNTLTAENIVSEGSVAAETLTIDGVELPSNHRHGGVQSGGSNTGTPIA
ncbi:MAG: Gp138 family membrane-puncturing spike protein [Gammaproteobacteria bacterium]